MASSHRKSLPSSCCQLCEGIETIQWKCLDCDLLLCVKCKDKLHPKFKKANDHRIIHLKEVGLKEGESLQGFDINDLKCREHQKQTCILFCRSCDKVVCPHCITKYHNGHHFLEVKQGYNIKVKELQNKKRKVEKHMDVLTKTKLELEQVWKVEHGKYVKTRQEILAQKANLDREAQKLLNRLDKEWKVTENAIEAKKSKVKVIETSCLEKSKYADDIARENDLEKFFKGVDECRKSLCKELPTVSVKLKSIPKFVPGVITDSTFGILTPVDKDLSNEAEGQTDITFRVVRNAETELPNIHYMCSCADGSLWLADNTKKILIKAMLEENQITVISRFDIDVFGISLIKSGNLLVSTGGSRLKVLIDTKSKLSDSFYNLPHLLISPITVTTDNKVILGATSEGQTFPAQGTRILVVVNEKGIEETKYEFDKNKKPAFSYPLGICTSETHIYVADQTGKNGTGKVITMGKKGDIINIYTGHPDVNRMTSFRPKGLAVIQSKYLVVTDLDTHTLHILDEQGAFIKFLNVQESGITHPYSLTISPSGNLFIGCVSAKGSSKQSKAQLHEIELSLD